MAVTLYGLGRGPQRAFQPLLSRAGMFTAKVGTYVADTTLTYAAQEVDLLSVPQGALVLPYVQVYMPTGFGTGTVVTIGSVSSAGAFTAYTNGAIAASTGNTLKSEFFLLTEAETNPVVADDKRMGLKFSGTITAQPSEGDLIHVVTYYTEISQDIPA